MSDGVKAPQHVAIIMDGNGRWANERGLERLAGHRAGAESVRRVVEACCRHGVRYLTLFSFSTENWRRSASEIAGLMGLFRHYLEQELPTLMKNGIRLRAVGDLEKLPPVVRAALNRVMLKTAGNTRLDLVLAVSYGGREELVAACRGVAEQVGRGELDPKLISAEDLRSHLWTRDIPDPDLLIRTSGEMRISNFLLWQLAYSEIVFTDVYWPEFDEAAFDGCLEEYSLRERRFGQTSDQLAGSFSAHESSSA